MSDEYDYDPRIHGTIPLGDNEPVCRGSWKLGNNCGACPKCRRFMVRLIAELVDSREPCRYDHNGLCQAHSLQEKPCPHETAKHLLTTAKHRHGIEVGW